MPTIRELVTKLSFAIDKTNLDKAEKSINNFRKQMSLVSASVAGSIYATEKFFSNIAESAMNVKTLSEYAGVSVGEFAAMRKGAADLGLSFSTFDKLSQKLSDHIRDSRVNTGQLFELWRVFPDKVKLPKFINETEDFKNSLISISNVLDTLSRRSDKLAFLSKFTSFDVNEAGQLLRFLEDLKGDFDSLTQSGEKFAQSFEENLPALRDYQIQLSKFGNILESLKNLAVKYALPLAISPIRNINFAAEVAQHPNPEIFYGASGERLFEPGEYNITNNFTFDVAPGTTNEQAGIMYDYVKEAVQDVFSQQIRDVVTNNPQLE